MDCDDNEDADVDDEEEEGEENEVEDDEEDEGVKEEGDGSGEALLPSLHSLWGLRQGILVSKCCIPSVLATTTSLFIEATVSASSITSKERNKDLVSTSHKHP